MGPQGINDQNAHLATIAELEKALAILDNIQETLVDFQNGHTSQKEFNDGICKWVTSYEEG